MEGGAFGRTKPGLEPLRLGGSGTTLTFEAQAFSPTRWFAKSERRWTSRSLAFAISASDWLGLFGNTIVPFFLACFAMTQRMNFRG